MQCECGHRSYLDLPGFRWNINLSKIFGIRRKYQSFCHGIGTWHIYKGKCHTFTEVSILKGTKRLLFLLLHPLVSHKFIHHSLLPFIQHFILFTYCLALQPRKNLHFLYDRQPFLLFANCLSLLTVSSHNSLCISSRHLSLDCTLLMFLVAYFQKYFQLPLFDLL